MDILKFAEIICNLKRTTRTGWTLFHVPHHESVADHSLSVALLAMVLAPQAKVDQLKVVKMALIHDLAESLIGDIVTEYGSKIISDPQNKKRDEFLALEMVIQVKDYEKLFHINLEPFFENVRTKIKNKYQISFLNKLEKSRKKI